jgi:hypothetical protein
VIFELSTVKVMVGVIVMVMVRENAAIQVTNNGSSLVVLELGGRKACLSHRPPTSAFQGMFPQPTHKTSRSPSQ